MSEPRPTPPPTPAARSKVVDLYFLEHRAKLIDIAAFLDRLDRAPADAGAGEPGPGTEDFRMAAFRRAVAVLSDGRPQRARRILELLSDHSDGPLDSAAGLKGAYGAAPPAAGRGTEP